MYESFYGLNIAPFNVCPDPRFLVLTRATRESLACLEYGVKSRKGFIVLTGEVGTGKTTLLNKLLASLRRSQVSTAFVFNPRLDVLDFLEFMMTDFGIPCRSRNKTQMLIQLNHWLLERYRAGENAVVIVDEAHELSHELLEEIRLLTNVETSTEKLLQVVLSGQPELDEKLRDPSLRQLRQRITLRCRTSALTPQQTAEYINTRLQIAGTKQAVFSPDAIDAIHAFSRGIPRVINLLCEHALISGFVEQKRPVTGDIVTDVAYDFELHEVPPVVSKDERYRLPVPPASAASMPRERVSAAGKEN